MVFLVGLTLATVPQCQVARSGCVISFSVVSVTLVSLVVHWIRCKKIKLKDSVRVREETSTSGSQQQVGSASLRTYTPLFGALPTIFAKSTLSLLGVSSKPHPHELLWNCRARFNVSHCIFCEPWSCLAPGLCVHPQKDNLVRHGFCVLVGAAYR